MGLVLWDCPVYRESTVGSTVRLTSCTQGKCRLAYSSSSGECSTSRVRSKTGQCRSGSGISKAEASCARRCCLPTLSITWQRSLGFEPSGMTGWSIRRPQAHRRVTETSGGNLQQLLQLKHHYCIIALSIMQPLLRYPHARQVNDNPVYVISSRTVLRIAYKSCMTSSCKPLWL